jgi:membrane-bound ClpP family serine protease
VRVDDRTGFDGDRQGISSVPLANKENSEMIILGVVLLLIGIFAGIPILTTIGVILLVIGAILFILGSMGRAVGGRKYWY